MTIVETATPAGAPTPLPLSNGADGPASMAAREPPKRGFAFRHPEHVREAVRRDVEGTTRTIQDIAEEHGVGKSTISAWIRKYGWRRPMGAPPLRIAGGGRDRDGQRARLVARLHTAFSAQLAALEKRASEAQGDSIDKDARTLGVLAKTLETLIELDRDGAKVGEPEPRDRGRLRLELAERIAAWAAERPQPTEPGRQAG
jgi:transposase-like protein